MLMFAQVQPGAPPAIDWQQLAAVYGPLVGVLAFVVKLHWDMIHKTIPEALVAVREEMQKHRKMFAHVMRELAALDMSRVRDQRPPREGTENRPPRRRRRQKRPAP